MFKCVTNLKGLIIDIDSFDNNYQEWEPLFEQYRCCFLTEDETLCVKIQKEYGTNSALYIELWEKLFAPSEESHSKVLQLMGLSTTEVAYVSKNFYFLKNALDFISGTILIKGFPIKYEQASRCPDLVLESVQILIKRLQKKKVGFYGENSISPDNPIETGSMLPISFKCDEGMIRLFSLGRYFSSDHYMSQLHPYSSAIYLNKKDTGKAYGVYNSRFSELYQKAAIRIKENIGVDCICNVPVRPGKADRFREMVIEVSQQTGLENVSESFICVRDYKTQKSLNSEEREENIKGAFLYTGNLDGKKVLLIDDVISSGATVRECIRSLKKAGATEVIVLVLAVNQLGGTYWTINRPTVDCPDCGNKMILLVNSNNRSFFYKCNQCQKMINYAIGKNRLIEKVNAEFVEYLEDEDIEFLL